MAIMRSLTRKTRTRTTHNGKDAFSTVEIQYLQRLQSSPALLDASPSPFQLTRVLTDPIKHSTTFHNSVVAVSKE